MPPRDPRHSGPIVPERHILPTQNDGSQHHATGEAAANVVRGQLSAIYAGRGTHHTPHTTPVPQQPPQSQPQPQPVPAAEPIVQQSIEADSPYDRTQQNTATVPADQWKQYHSAWQEYYQKYYERYYVGQVYRARQVLEDKAREASTATDTPTQPAAQPSSQSADKAVAEADETFSRDEALYDLRSKIRQRVGSSARKVRKSRHFVPIISALAVMLVFAFLQYNAVIFATVNAYVSPGSIDPTNIIVDPISTIAPSDDPRLIIPKLNVDVPVNWNTKPDYDSQMEAMKNAVAWFGIPGADAHPGEVGNTVLSGHSSNQWYDNGKYKFIFVRLDDLTKGDTVYVNYQGTRYTYSVTGKKVVAPTDVQALVYPTDKPILTLITCTPIGTSQNRLLVTAEQISPDPSSATAAPDDSSNSGKPTQMPGNSPTVFEKLFGLGG